MLVGLEAQEFLDQGIARPLACAPLRAESHGMGGKQKVLNGSGSGGRGFIVDILVGQPQERCVTGRTIDDRNSSARTDGR